MALDRVRFTIAHELGHLVMHSSPTGDVEAEADRFASELLMPEFDIRPQLVNATLNAFALLKRVWRVSMQALLRRARDLKAISAKWATELWKQMSALGFGKREPAELDLSPERPRLLRAMIEYHRKRLGLTEVQLRSMLSLFEPDFRRYYAWDERRAGTLRLVG